MGSTPGREQFHNLPFCPLSAHSVRLVDVIDCRWKTPDLPGEEPQERAFIQQLCLHVQRCRTCAALLERASEQRAQQRLALRALLSESEMNVPATVSQIMAALNHERHLAQQLSAQQNHHYQRLVPVDISHPLPAQRPAARWRTLFTLCAVAAIILASLALFSHMTWLRATSSASLATATPLRFTNEWSSILIARPAPTGGGQIIENYDPFGGKYVQLASTCCTPDMHIDSISHDGRNLIYRRVSGNTTAYHLLSGQVYTIEGQGSNAAWTTDDSAIFAATASGLVQINIATGRQKRFPFSLNASSLAFYSNGFLYFTREKASARNDLFRVNLATGAQNFVAESTSVPPAAFWLAPTGSTIYYCGGSGSEQGMYAVNSDGSQAHLQRKESVPIGYAADNTLMSLREVQGKFQVVKLGATSEQDAVIVSNLAPGAAAISDIALAPYATALVAKITYPDSSFKLLSFDLRTTRQRVLIDAPARDQAGSVQLLGWSRLQVPGATPAFSDWSKVMLSSSDARGGRMKLVNYDTRTGGSNGLPIGTLPSIMQIDGISPDGKNVLYHSSSAGRTTYWTLAPKAGSGYFFALAAGEAGNAIWMPDSRFALITTLRNGVLKVDTQTGAAQSVLPSLKTGGLAFYRAPFLYFIGAENLATGALYRVAISGGTPQRITDRAPSTTFWLSPGGATVYYVNTGSAGAPGIQAVKSDGSARSVVSNDGLPIGYASDGALMIMRQVGKTFQVVKLGTPPMQDQVILADVAPGATSLCSRTVPPGVPALCGGNIALAPLGDALVVVAGYADGSHRMWSIDLPGGQRTLLATLTGRSQPGFQLIGWDNMAV